MLWYKSIRVSHTYIWVSINCVARYRKYHAVSTLALSMLDISALPTRTHMIVSRSIRQPHAHPSTNFLLVHVLTNRFLRFKKLSCPKDTTLFKGLDSIGMIWFGVSYRYHHNLTNSNTDISYVPNPTDSHSFWGVKTDISDANAHVFCP